MCFEFIIALVLVCTGGLAEEITERVLYSAFITFGEIVEVQIPRDPATRTVESSLSARSSCQLVAQVSSRLCPLCAQ